MAAVGLGFATPKARKAHPCGWCVEEIAPGETYIKATGIYDGHFYTWSLHEECYRAEEDAYAYNAPMDGEPACYNCDIDGGSHERGKNCAECSDMPIQPEAAGGGDSDGD